MKTKFLLPVLAMIFAIGMSFTTSNSANDPNMDYYSENGNLLPIGQELTCGSGSSICRVQFEENGPIYEVYDSKTPAVRKTGNGTLIKLWQ